MKDPLKLVGFPFFRGLSNLLLNPLKNVLYSQLFFFQFSRNKCIQFCMYTVHVDTLVHVDNQYM